MTELQNPWRPLLSPNLRSCSNLPKPIARKFACDFPGIKNINNTGNSNGANNAILCKSNIRHMENGWKMDEHCQLDDRFVNLPKKVVDSYGSFNHGFSHGFPLYDLRLQSLAKPEGLRRCEPPGCYQAWCPNERSPRNASAVADRWKMDGIHGCEQMASFYRWTVHQKWWSYQ